MPDPKAGLTDAELVEIVAKQIDPEAWHPSHYDAGNSEEWEKRRSRRRETARSVLASIRRPLEARGIEAAAEWHRSEAEKTMSGVTPYSSLRHDVELAEAATDHELAAEALEALARQHAAGEDGK